MIVVVIYTINTQMYPLVD